MSSITNLLTDYNDKLNNIIIDKIQHYSPNYDKVNIYNTNKPSLLQKIWILTPKLKVVSIITKPNHKFYNVLPLRLLVSMADHKQFLLFIRRIEHKIGELITKTQIKSRVEENNKKYCILNVNMPYNGNNEFTFQIYNQNNQRIKASDIKSGCYVKCYLELSDVYINKDNYGCNWSVLQMKVYPEFNFSVCLFENDTTDTNNNPEEPEECYHCLYCPNNHVRTCMNLPTIPTDSALLPIAPPLPPSQVNLNISPTITPNPLVIRKTNNISNKPFVPSMSDLLGIKLKKVDVSTNKQVNDKYLCDILDVRNKLKPLEDLLEKELLMLQ